MYHMNVAGCGTYTPTEIVTISAKSVALQLRQVELFVPDRFLCPAKCNWGTWGNHHGDGNQNFANQRVTSNIIVLHAPYNYTLWYICLLSSAKKHRNLKLQNPGFYAERERFKCISEIIHRPYEFISWILCKHKTNCMIRENCEEDWNNWTFLKTFSSAWLLWLCKVSNVTLRNVMFFYEFSLHGTNPYDQKPECKQHCAVLYPVCSCRLKPFPFLLCTSFAK